jgi:hypothetical protein
VKLLKQQKGNNMIKFKTDKLGQVVLKFRHHLPNITVPERSNSLVAMINATKLTQGYTSCELQLDVVDGYPSYTFFGTAYVHPNDMYRKETGRLLSLTRAVEYAVKDGVLEDSEGRSIMAGYYSR